MLRHIKEQICILQPCSLMWRICQCCSLKYFLPKNPEVSFCERMWWNISKGTWPLQFAWGIRSFFQNNEENDVFTKNKGPFSLNVKFKGWFCQCEQWKWHKYILNWLVIIEMHLYSKSILFVQGNRQNSNRCATLADIFHDTQTRGWWSWGIIC